MKDILIEKTILNINKYYQFDDIKMKEIKYGIETFYMTIFKLIIIIIISFIFNTSKELFLLLLAYGLLRLTGFGLHAKNSILCWVLSIATFSLLPYLIKTIQYFTNAYYFLAIVFVILISVFAPSDTIKRPLINKKKRIVFKIITTITSTIYLIIIFTTKSIYIKKLLFYSLLLELLLINPISYKLLGLSYNNYKLYKKKGGKYEIIS